MVTVDVDRHLTGLKWPPLVAFNRLVVCVYTYGHPIFDKSAIVPLVHALWVLLTICRPRILRCAGPAGGGLTRELYNNSAAIGPPHVWLDFGSFYHDCANRIDKYTRGEGREKKIRKYLGRNSTLDVYRTVDCVKHITWWCERLHQCTCLLFSKQDRDPHRSIPSLSIV